MHKRAAPLRAPAAAPPPAGAAGRSNGTSESHAVGRWSPAPSQALCGDLSRNLVAIRTKADADTVTVTSAGIPYLNRVALGLTADVRTLRHGSRCETIPTKRAQTRP